MNLRRAALLASVLACGALAAVTAEPVIAAPVTAKLGIAGKQARQYWTPQRMRAAVPIDRLLGPAPPRTTAGAAATDAPAGPPLAFAGTSPAQRSPLRAASVQPANHKTPATDQIADPNQAPYWTHGRIFARIRGIGDYSCSGTVVSSNNGSVIVTAGHCVFAILFKRSGLVRRFASKFVFVPAYNEGSRPQGTWAGRKVAIPGAYFKRERITSDIAAVRLETKGGSIESVVGSRGIAFNFPRNQTYQAFGYPAAFPFDGEHLFRCTSGFEGNDPSTRFEGGPKTMMIICDMTGGSSGGGWVIKENSAECGVPGCVASVVSYGYDFRSERDHLYGPYFSRDAKQVWTLVQNNCKGSLPTPGMTGTAGPDTITGTPGRDVIVTYGGSDRIKGLGGNDKICAGPGADVVEGDAGADKLFGEGGADKLLAGPGRDSCDGGGGIDRAPGCERKKNVP